MSVIVGCKDYRYIMYIKNIYNELSKNLIYRNIKFYVEV